MEISAEIVGERDIAFRLEGMPDRLEERLFDEISALTERLHAGVVAAEPERTGRLRGETRFAVDRRPGLVRGRVFVAAETSREHGKAAALEYGAHGAVQVGAYRRSGHTPRGDQAEQLVAAYTRHADIVARRFERGQLEALEGQITEGVRRAIAEASA